MFLFVWWTLLLLLLQTRLFFSPIAPYIHTTHTHTGKCQIFATILLAEIATEAGKPHYMKGGPLPEMVIPKVDFSGVDAAVLKTKRARELNNGRLAQIAIMSFIAEYNIPGSVPVLSSIPAFHS